MGSAFSVLISDNGLYIRTRKIHTQTQTQTQIQTQTHRHTDTQTHTDTHRHTHRHTCHLLGTVISAGRWTPAMVTESVLLYGFQDPRFSPAFHCTMSKKNSIQEKKKTLYSGGKKTSLQGKSPANPAKAYASHTYVFI